MGNVVDYVRREFRGFGELAFSNVDSLVLSELSYMRLPGLVPAFGEAKSVATVPIRDLLRAESYDEMFVSNSSEMNDYRLSLLRAVCESPRFRGLRVGEYDERLDEASSSNSLRWPSIWVPISAYMLRSVALTARSSVGKRILIWRCAAQCVARIGISICGLDSGQDGTFPLGEKITRHYDRRAFQRRQYGGICGHANHAKRY